MTEDQMTEEMNGASVLAAESRRIPTTTLATS
jgi:hypothetical protein